MTERRVDVPGGSLALRDFGAGPPIVLMHASIVTSWAWEPLTPFLLDAGYRAVAFDRRDAGESTTEDVAYSNRADTVAVLDALGLGQAVLVGNSAGGQVAIDTAIEFPSRVAAVVTIGAHISGWFPRQTPEEDALDAEMDRVAASLDPDAIADLDVRAWVDGPGQSPERVPHEIRELVREMDHELVVADPWGMPIPMEPPAAQRLDGLTAPVLAVAGELDFSFAAATVRYLAANAPDARAVVMPGVAHMIALEAPGELAALITDFLAPLPRWR